MICRSSTGNFSIGAGTRVSAVVRESRSWRLEADGFAVLRWCLPHAFLVAERRRLRPDVLGGAEPFHPRCCCIQHTTPDRTHTPHLVRRTAGAASAAKDRTFNTWRIAFKLAY